LIKIWFTGAAFILIMLLYHALERFLKTWFQRLDRTDENARIFVSTLRSILKYATVGATVIIVLNMLGLLNPLQRIMSFPIFQLGDTTVTFWLIVMAILILLVAAENEPLVDKSHTPAVRFVEYADNSINFQLLVWIDVRKTPRRRIRSNLYFVIFEEFVKAGIEIPFPQRDVHIRSQVDSA